MTPPPFADRWLEPFRSSAYSLRFELGGERFGIEAPVPRFLRAFGRARQVAREVFDSSPRLFGIVAAPSASADDRRLPAPDGFAALEAAGFAGRPVGQWQGALRPDQAEEEDRVPCEWRAYDLTGDVAGQDVILWCAVALEMAITPRAAVLSYLLDPDRDILLHVYDDRGMDVTALDREKLLTLYEERADWLLDYDRPRMREAFREPPG
jgi:hypothetical protein